MRNLDLCWYCEEYPKKNKDSLFCKKCENLKIKEVNRSPAENFYDKI